MYLFVAVHAATLVSKTGADTDTAATTSTENNMFLAQIPHR